MTWLQGWRCGVGGRPAERGWAAGGAAPGRGLLDRRRCEPVGRASARGAMAADSLTAQGLRPRRGQVRAGQRGLHARVHHGIHGQVRIGVLRALPRCARVRAARGRGVAHHPARQKDVPAGGPCAAAARRACLLKIPDRILEERSLCRRCRHPPSITCDLARHLARL
jgi:hypothetical protein